MTGSEKEMSKRSEPAHWDRNTGANEIGGAGGVNFLRRSRTLRASWREDADKIEIMGAVMAAHVYNDADPRQKLSFKRAFPPVKSCTVATGHECANSRTGRTNGREDISSRV